jgi:hypothetical protein
MKLPAWLFLSVAPLAAQMTLEQKLLDFGVMVSMYNKHYAPYEWKRDALGYDMFDLGPWLARIHDSKDDLDFFEICAEYVVSLRDTHSSFSMLSNFSATLGFTVDIFGGRLLIDSINRTTLPASRYEFQIGDELIALDGKPAAEWLEYTLRFSAGANPRSAARRAAHRITSRSQSIIPRAHEIGETARVEIQRPDGTLLVYDIPWIKTGTPVTSAGRLPSPVFKSERATAATDDDVAPAWVAPLNELRLERDPETADLVGYGSLAPVYSPPQGFRQRLGRVSTDYFYSGEFEAEGFRIGLIRIPNFSPSSTTAALRAFEAEIAYFQENTDGLIVDVTRNNGGDACYNEEIQRRLIPYRFRAMAREIRATTRFLNSFASSLETARRINESPEVIARLEARFEEVRRAYESSRGRTGPVPICSDTLERDPAGIVYSKPLMVLVDEFSTSAADAFPAVLQDNRRGPLFGWRTNGAGGTTGSFRTGVYSEFSASHTIAMHHRKEPVITPDYPPTHYVENVGVRPDIEYDFMTRENLVTGGRPFVEAFTAAMVEHIRKNR